MPNTKTDIIIFAILIIALAVIASALVFLPHCPAYKTACRRTDIYAKYVDDSGEIWCINMLGMKIKKMGFRCD